jgi:hypothetical protein
VSLYRGDTKVFQRAEYARQTGGFRFTGLEGGRYYLEVSEASLGLYEAGEKVYPARFYPDKTDIRSAKAIEVVPGGETQIEFRLPAVRGYQISGHISGDIRPGNRLGLLPALYSPIQYRASSWDQQTHAFKFSGVPSGTYTLYAMMSEAGKIVNFTTTVTVEDADVEGIVLAPSGTQ